MRIEGDSFDDILNRVRVADFNARTAAMSTLLAGMKPRIHNDGEKTDGTLIGGYAFATIKARKAVNLQTDYIDLEFNGDLRASLQVGKSEGVPVLGFASEEQFKKASGLSFGNDLNLEGFGEIWTPNEDEIDDMFNAYLTQFENELNALR